MLETKTIAGVQRKHVLSMASFKTHNVPVSQLLNQCAKGLQKGITLTLQPTRPNIAHLTAPAFLSSQNTLLYSVQSRMAIHP